jgi:hypothetical protein
MKVVGYSTTDLSKEYIAVTLERSMKVRRIQTPSTGRRLLKYTLNDNATFWY